MSKTVEIKLRIIAFAVLSISCDLIDSVSERMSLGFHCEWFPILWIILFLYILIFRVTLIMNKHTFVLKEIGIGRTNVKWILFHFFSCIYDVVCYCCLWIIFYLLCVCVVIQSNYRIWLILSVATFVFHQHTRTLNHSLTHTHTHHFHHPTHNFERFSFCFCLSFYLSSLFEFIRFNFY